MAGGAACGRCWTDRALSWRQFASAPSRAVAAVQTSPCCTSRPTRLAGERPAAAPACFACPCVMPRCDHLCAARAWPSLTARARPRAAPRRLGAAGVKGARRVATAASAVSARRSALQLRRAPARGARVLCSAGAVIGTDVKNAFELLQKGYARLRCLGRALSARLRGNPRGSSLLAPRSCCRNHSPQRLFCA